MMVSANSANKDTSAQLLVLLSASLVDVVSNRSRTELTVSFAHLVSSPLSLVLARLVLCTPTPRFLVHANALSAVKVWKSIPDRLDAWNVPRVNSLLMKAPVKLVLLAVSPPTLVRLAARAVDVVVKVTPIAQLVCSAMLVNSLPTTVSANCAL